MFDQIIAPRRSSRHRKSALALALLLNISGIGSMMTVGDVQSIIEAASDEPLIFVELVAPAPAPAAPTAAALAPSSTPDPAPQPPDRAHEEPAEPAAPAEPDAPQLDAADAIVAVGLIDAPASPGGCPPGQRCAGPPDAPGSGCPPDEACDGDTMLLVSSADVQPKRRVRPSYPAAAKALNIAEARCLVRFQVDAKGRPTDISVSGCPSVFHAEVLEAAWQWRFYPVRDRSGAKSAATFTLALSFRLS